MQNRREYTSREERSQTGRRPRRNARTLCYFPLRAATGRLKHETRHRPLENPPTQEIAERKADDFLSALYEEGQRNKVTANVLIDLLKRKKKMTTN